MIKQLLFNLKLHTNIKIQNDKIMAMLWIKTMSDNLHLGQNIGSTTFDIIYVALTQTQQTQMTLLKKIDAILLGLA